ncbi:hypothetical protein RFI_16058, partial [Reticulomyxa filosa]
ISKEHIMLNSFIAVTAKKNGSILGVSHCRCPKIPELDQVLSVKIKQFFALTYIVSQKRLQNCNNNNNKNKKTTQRRCNAVQKRVWKYWIDVIVMKQEKGEMIQVGFFFIFFFLFNQTKKNEIGTMATKEESPCNGKDNTQMAELRCCTSYKVIRAFSAYSLSFKMVCRASLLLFFFFFWLRLIVRLHNGIITNERVKTSYDVDMVSLLERHSNVTEWKSEHGRLPFLRTSQIALVKPILGRYMVQKIVKECFREWKRVSGRDKNTKSLILRKWLAYIRSRKHKERTIQQKLTLSVQCCAFQVIFY